MGVRTNFEFTCDYKGCTSKVVTFSYTAHPHQEYVHEHAPATWSLITWNGKTVLYCDKHADSMHYELFEVATERKSRA